VIGHVIDWLAEARVPVLSRLASIISAPPPAPAWLNASDHDILRALADASVTPGAWVEPDLMAEALKRATAHIGRDSVVVELRLAAIDVLVDCMVARPTATWRSQGPPHIGARAEDGPE